MTALPLTCVLDASAGMKLVLPEAGAAEVRQLLAQSQADPSQFLTVPDLFFVECANVLWKGTRRGSYSREAARARLESLRAIPFEVAATRGLVASALILAGQHGISVYDACYVALAADKGIPLLTAERRLEGLLAGAPFDIVVLGE